MSGMTKVLRPYLFDLVNWCEVFIHILKGFFIGTDEIARNQTTNQHNKAWVMFIILEICIVSQKGKWWLHLLYCSLKDGALRSKYSFQTHYTEKNAWELIVHRITSWNGNILYWPFVRGVHQSSVDSPHKGQWRGALTISLICAGINVWVNNREAGDLRRYRAHYDVIIKIIIRPMPQNPAEETSKLAHSKAICRQSTINYLNQCWLMSYATILHH